MHMSDFELRLLTAMLCLPYVLVAIALGLVAWGAWRLARRMVRVRRSARTAASSH